MVPFLSFKHGVRFFYLLFLAVALIIPLKSCNPLGSNDDEYPDLGRPDRGGRSSRDRNREDDPRDMSNNRRFVETDVSLDNSDFTGQVEPTEATNPITVSEPIVQRGLSNAIDFLFIIDASATNKYIHHPNIKNHLGTFPLVLNRLGIRWKMFFMNSEYKEECSDCRNSRLYFLEYNGTLIRSQYLDNQVLSSYGNPVAETFIDTLEQELVGGTDYCDFPPYCQKKKKTNRPLKSFHEFILNSQNVLSEDADLMVIIITNTDEQPSFKKPKKQTEATQIISRFQSVHSNKNLYAISVVVMAGDSKCKKDHKSNVYASYVPQLSLLTNGLIIDICASTSDVNAYTDPIINFIQKLISQ